MLIRNQERRHGAATGELAGGREVEGDDLQHLQLRLRPEGKGRRGGCQVIPFFYGFPKSFSRLDSVNLMLIYIWFGRLKPKLNEP